MAAEKKTQITIQQKPTSHQAKNRVIKYVRVTPWTAAYQAPPAMGFSRQEYGSGVPLPSPV